MPLVEYRSRRLSASRMHRRRRGSLVIERLEGRALLAGDISISDATLTEGNDAIKFIDRFVTERSGGLDFVSGTDFGPDGNGDGAADLYVVSARNDKILRFDGKSGAFIDEFIVGGDDEISQATPLFGPDGTLYVVNGRLRVYDASTRAFIQEITWQWGLGLPRLDPNGVLHLAGLTEIVRYQGGGVSVVVPEGSGGLIHVTGFDFGPDVNGDGSKDLYVGSMDANNASKPRKILRYDGVTGEFIDVFKTYPTGKLGGMGQFGPDGLLYAVVQNGFYSPPNPPPPLHLTRFDPLSGAEIDSFPWPNGPFAFGPDGLIYRSGWTAGNVVDRYGPASVMAFTVSLNSPSTTPVTVNYATSNGTATAGSDYQATAGTVTFAPGQTKLTVVVKSLKDAAVELSETFTVNLTSAVGGTIVDSQGIGTIHDNTGSRSILIGDATAIEGSNALKYLDRFVSEGSGGLARPRGSTFGPDGNFDGAPELYVASADTNQILRYDGRTGAFIGVFVSAGSGGLNGVGDLKFGQDGNIYVSSGLANQVLRYNGSTGAFIDVVASGLATPLGLTFDSNGNLYIANQNNDEVLRYNASGTSVFIAAGSGGLDQPRNAVFGPDGNGDGRQDLYVASQGTREVLRYDGMTGTFIDKFATTSLGVGPIWIEFGGDNRLYAAVRTDSAGNETTILRFDATNGAFVDRFDLARDGWSFILGPDNLVYDSANSSGNFVDRYGPASFAVFTVSLSAPSSTPVTVDYSTANGSAVAGDDYQAVAGALTFAPGETTRTILLRTWNDAAAEPSETFTVNLSRVVGAIIGDGQGTATIQDDDSAGPSISINDVTVTEGADTQVVFTVRLSGPHSSPVTVAYATTDGTALAGINYAAKSGTLTFSPGETQQTIAVPILNDGTTYPTETFTVNLSNAIGVAIGDGQGVGTIEDEDFSDLTVTLRVSANGQMLETYLGNPISPGEDPVHAWPMSSQLPLVIETDLFEGVESPDAVFVELPAGSEGPRGGIVLDTGLGVNRLHVRSGRVRIDSVSTGGKLNTIVDAGAELVTEQLQQNGLTVNGNGRVTLLTDGDTSRLTSLSLDAGAALNLADNALVIDYTGTSPLATLREKILSGRGGPGFAPTWTGTGIQSSAAAQANKADPESRSIGVVENAAMPLGPYATFRGQQVDSTSVLIAYTRTGDANLDGLVNDDDVTIVGATYAPGVPQASWALGDFDYNGFVDDDDVTLLGVFYNPAANPPPVPRVVVWSGDRATASTEGLLGAGTLMETYGQSSVRSAAADAHNKETRAQQRLPLDAGAVDQLIAEPKSTWTRKWRLKATA